MTIKDIQEWEKNFAKNKNINFTPDEAAKIGMFKLIEEVGEVAKAITEKQWDEVPAEVSDVIIFACKIANIAEDFHGAKKLEDVLKRKIAYCEKRVFDKRSKKFNKPKDKNFK